MVLLDDDRPFWSARIGEHQQLIHDYANDSGVKRDALALRRKWDQAYKLDDLEVLSLMGETLEFQNELQSRLNDGEWLGSLLPSLLEHWTDELEYATDKVAGNSISDEEEILFWSDLISDHASVDSHLLDVSEKALIEEATSISEDAENVSNEQEFLLDLTQKYMGEIIAFHEDAQETKPRSIIHPLLLTHELQEERRGRMILNIIASRSQ